MNPRSNKAKGRRLQNLLRDKLRELYCNTTVFPKLHEDDIKSQTMGMPGEDIILSPKAKKMIPYSFECKNVERFQFWSSIEQAEGNTDKDRTPVIVVKKNRKSPYVALPLDQFLKLIRRI